MYGLIIGSNAAFGGYINVWNALDIAHLVKESEVLTGQPGRKFFICGAERLIYRIQSDPNGYRVQRLDESENPLSEELMQSDQILEHSLCYALREGCLFTPVLP